MSKSTSHCFWCVNSFKLVDERGRVLKTQTLVIIRDFCTFTHPNAKFIRINGTLVKTAQKSKITFLLNSNEETKVYVFVYV